MVGASFGVGFAVAPSLGGYLSKTWDVLFPLYASLLLQVSCMVSRTYDEDLVFYLASFIFGFSYKKPELGYLFRKIVFQM